MRIYDLSYLLKHKEEFLSGFTIKEIFDELKYDYKILANIKVMKVEKEYIDYVKNVAKEIGIIDYISETDLKLCALAYKYKDKAILYTNDFYIQNLCYFLGVKFEGDKKIKYAKIFRYYCDKCNILNETVRCKCGNIGKRKVIKFFKLPTS